jgi:hypothetical protein
VGNLTIKQRRLISGVASGLPKRTAAIQAGYSEQSAHAIAYETLNNPEVLKSLDEIMQQHGITDTYIAQKLIELAEASTKGIPHWPARARALDMMLKVKGLYSQEPLEPKTEISIEQARARIMMLLPRMMELSQTRLAQE